jgi:hypothetical protein
LAAAFVAGLLVGWATLLAADFSDFAPLGAETAAFRATVSVVVAALTSLDDLEEVAALAAWAVFPDVWAALVLAGGAVFLAVIVHL